MRTLKDIPLFYRSAPTLLGRKPLGINLGELASSRNVVGLKVGPRQ